VSLRDAAAKVRAEFLAPKPTALAAAMKAEINAQYRSLEAKVGKETVKRWLEEIGLEYPPEGFG